MKKLLFLSLFILICSSAYADVYVIFKTDTKEVISIQDDDSAILEEGQTKKVILDKTISDYQFEYLPRYYKFSNDKFVVNTKKISDEENAEIAKEEKKVEKALIDKKLEDLAIDELKKEGVVLKHFKKTGE